jgi:hypothetical protein
MNEFVCPREQAVTLAVRNGQCSEELRAHISHCAECAEVERIAGWLGHVAERLRDRVSPHPTLVWIKAQLEEQHRNEMRAIRQAAFRQAFIRLPLGLVGLVSGAWMWPTLKPVLAHSRTLAPLLPDWTSAVVLLALAGPMALCSGDSAQRSQARAQVSPASGQFRQRHRN